MSSSRKSSDQAGARRERRGRRNPAQHDGMMLRSPSSNSFHGVRFDGRTYDCGSKLGFLTANIAFALDRPDLAPALRAEIRKLGAVRTQAQARCSFNPSIKTLAM